MEIRERLSRCALHPGVPEAERAISECIVQLKDLLLDCSVCAGQAFGSCAECVKVQGTIGWALERLRSRRRK